jgi:PPE-repeat protein
MDFGVYPPEVNSGRMYAGPGSGPLLAAAQAWAALADELSAAAGAYESVVSCLTAGPWAGPASVAMTAAAAPYIAWLSTAAGRAEETATRATAAVAAYDAAFAMTVPPPVIAANRSLLAALVATNFFGQNTVAIAAAEAQYAQMWAQDAAAMYTYAGSSAAATALTPLTSPRPNTHPGAAAQILAAVPAALQSMATPALALPSQTVLDTVGALIVTFISGPIDGLGLAVDVPLSATGGLTSFPLSIGGYLIGLHTDDIVSGWNGEQSWPGTAPGPVKEFPATLLDLPLGTVPTLAAGMGSASTVGSLSVPSAWTVEAPEIRPLALAVPAVDVVEAEQQATLVAAQAEAGSGTTLSDLGIAAMTGRAMAGPPGPAAAQGTTTIAGAPAARVIAALGDGRPIPTPGSRPGEPRVVVTGVAARIRELARLRDEGELTDDEYAELKNRLLGC